jgi:pimeloyl-ACP methyl ester carboxylesterase
MAIREALHLARFFIDIGWATGEYASKVALDPMLRRLAPRPTSPKAVLTLPGFGGPEISLSPLNAFLARQGFMAEGWGLGTNRGPRGADALPQLIDALKPKLERMAEKSGGKVALVGQSLGGIYAREIARALPDLTDRVITLGSPAYLKADGLDHMNATLHLAMRWINGKKVQDHLTDTPPEALHEAPPVPLVAIFSAFDGVVDETTTAIPTGELTFEGRLPRENIEIVGSHCGMAVNPIVLVAVCDRLLIDSAKWTAFDARAYMPTGTGFATKLFYPGPRNPARSRRGEARTA